MKVHLLFISILFINTVYHAGASTKAVTEDYFHKSIVRLFYQFIDYSVKKGAPFYFHPLLKRGYFNAETLKTRSFYSS